MSEVTDQKASAPSFKQASTAKELRQNRFGLILFVTSQMVPYFMLINDRFVLADTYVSRRVDPLLGGFLPTLLLLLGVLPSWLAVRAIARNALLQMQRQLQLTGLLGVLALIVMVWPMFSHRYDAISPFGEIHLVSLGLGGFFTLAALFVLGSVLLRATKGVIGPQHYFSVEASAWVWTFNAIAWLVLYIAVYFI
ncbi:cytochrome c oxidase subunit 3 [Sulfoacidibacillus thermotolerans]|uniref:cytochrome-c oxidase n=1 Tax=Sulfoacidibacillus thermotolerans TaxID=1765684 RepID=A0A2U3D963_SULT2|nr:cytochrome c oxidase subunit 3 [Sulfoacidibacillus thermotolerans]PWI57817.1 hypothetical protein BM613_06390 [Sulfoacidibacillus thermotolerans]